MRPRSVQQGRHHRRAALPGRLLRRFRPGWILQQPRWSLAREPVHPVRKPGTAHRADQAVHRSGRPRVLRCFRGHQGVPDLQEVPQGSVPDSAPDPGDGQVTGL
uniref:(northern house mosquito) hypothetical protein n=1 Tax=Culex pipiens TaxID=7175 RepID=A0A8D8NQQ1_CULPI